MVTIFYINSEWLNFIRISFLIICSLHQNSYVLSGASTRPSFLLDPDCVRGHPFWPSFQRLVTSAIDLDVAWDTTTARHALTKVGCPLGKLTACLMINHNAGININTRHNINDQFQNHPSQDMNSPIDCFFRIHDNDFAMIMSSRWPIYAILDRINTRRVLINLSGPAGDIQGGQNIISQHYPHLNLHFNEGNINGLMNIEIPHTVDISETRNLEDCEVPDHPTIDWNDFRNWTRHAVTESVNALTKDRPGGPRANLDIAMEFGGGIIWKSASRTNLDGQPVMVWTNQCALGVAAAVAFRGFGALISENDVFRGTERTFQQLENVVSQYLPALIETKWRIFGLLHVLSLLKRYRLDLPASVVDLVDIDTVIPDPKSSTGELRRFRVKKLEDLNSAAEIENNQKLKEQYEDWGIETHAETESILNDASYHAERRILELAALTVTGDKVIFVTMPRDKMHMVTDFFERSLHSASECAIGFLVEEPLLQISCESSVRAAWMRSEQLKEMLREQYRVLKGEEISPDTDLSEWNTMIETFLHQNQHIYKRHCLPRLSVTSPFLSLLGYMRKAVLAGIDTGFMTLHHFFIKKNPFPYLWHKDINVDTEFYAPHNTRMNLLTLQATINAAAFLDDYLRILYKFPFSVRSKVLPRIIFGKNVPDTVPSLSFGEEGFFREHLPYVHFLDTENQFINHEAWYGEWDRIVLFECEPHYLDTNVLATMYEGERKVDAVERDLALGRQVWMRKPGSDTYEEITEVEPIDFRDHMQFIRRAQRMNSPKKATIEKYSSPDQQTVFLDGAGRSYLEDGWRAVPGMILRGFAAGVEKVFENDVDHAKQLCLQLGSGLCAGIVCEDVNFSRCTIRDGEPEIFEDVNNDEDNADRANNDRSKRKPWTRTLIPIQEEIERLGQDPQFPESPTSVVLIAPGIRFLTNERISHANFADNCCEEDQKKSSDTAVEIGKLEISTMKNGSHLSEEFREKNHELLTYYRHPALTKHKTPTAKKGYYVWKAYIFKQMLEDVDRDDIIVWSDAGVSFLKDMRPLLARYLRGSDVSGCRTVMMEGDWTKRDAFLIMDMDYKAVVETNQIASSMLMARRTELSMQLAKLWLIHSEDPRAMTEEDSVLGYPEYPHYHNHNDDQSIMSLNFKKFGFEAFSTSLRDEYVLLGRNLAKFIANSNAFARGKNIKAKAPQENSSESSESFHAGSADSENSKAQSEDSNNSEISEGQQSSTTSDEDRERLKKMKTREISEKLNKGEADFKIDTSNQDYYIDEAKLRNDDIVRRHRDGSYELWRLILSWVCKIHALIILTIVSILKTDTVVTFFKQNQSFLKRHFDKEFYNENTESVLHVLHRKQHKIMAVESNQQITIKLFNSVNSNGSPYETKDSNILDILNLNNNLFKT